jgi:hypothetical protein
VGDLLGEILINRGVVVMEPGVFVDPDHAAPRFPENQVEILPEYVRPGSRDARPELAQALRAA